MWTHWGTVVHHRLRLWARSSVSSDLWGSVTVNFGCLWPSGASLCCSRSFRIDSETCLCFMFRKFEDSSLNPCDSSLGWKQTPPDRSRSHVQTGWCQRAASKEILDLMESGTDGLLFRLKKTLAAVGALNGSTNPGSHNAAEITNTLYRSCFLVITADFSQKGFPTFFIFNQNISSCFPPSSQTSSNL